MRNRSVILWILATTLLPLFVGGDLDRWLHGIVLCMMGALFLVSPPRHPMKRGTGWVMLALFAVSLTAFLPASWFGIPQWRHDITGAGIALPRTLSPAPWLSLDGVALLGAGLLWIYYLAGRTWEREDRLFAMRALGVAVLALTAISLICYYAEWMPPLWEGQNYFGPIANRNQTAIILCLGALVCAGCAFYEFNGRHKTRAAFWVAGLPLIFAGLVINHSRAGVLLFFGGLGAWIALVSYKKKSAGTFAAAGSVLLLLAASFFLFGGRTLERLRTNEEDLASFVKGEARYEIFGETLELITVAPLFGTGFGNFGPVYALHRDLEDSSVLSRVAQPDNDWLWLATETGLVGLALALATVILLGLRAFPLTGKKRNHGDRSIHLRIPAIVAVALFCVDGTVNIPGHRMAVVLIGMLLFALALHSNRRRRTFRPLRPFFRVAGAALILVGAGWIGATATGRALPGSIGIENLSEGAFEAHVDGDFERSIELVDEVIRRQPLRYRHYSERAVYSAEAGRPLEESLRDFQIARMLEPSHPIIPLGEVEFWLGLRPVYAIPALEDALRRFPAVSPVTFREMMERSGIDPLFRKALGEVALTDPRLQVQYFAEASREEIAAQIERIIDEDPELKEWDRPQRKTLFSYWYRFGDREALVEQILSRHEWIYAGWRELCRYYSDTGEFKAAVEIARQHIPAPALPRRIENRTTEELRHTFTMNAGDVSAGIRLYQAEWHDGDREAAVATLEKTTSLSGCPDYAFYVLAEARATLERFEEAWKSLETYMRRKPPL